MCTKRTEWLPRWMGVGSSHVCSAQWEWSSPGLKRHVQCANKSTWPRKVCTMHKSHFNTFLCKSVVRCTNVHKLCTSHVSSATALSFRSRCHGRCAICPRYRCVLNVSFYKSCPQSVLNVSPLKMCPSTNCIFTESVCSMQLPYWRMYV